VSRGLVYGIAVSVILAGGATAAARIVRPRNSDRLVPERPGTPFVSDGEYIPAFDHDLPRGSAGYSNEP
jgi:hypothetical protein